MRTKPLSSLLALSLLGLAMGQAQAQENSPENHHSGGDNAVTSGTGFNPAISVILDGVFSRSSREVEEPAGFGDGDEHGHGHGHGEEGHSHGVEEGFQLREAELVLSGPVDPYFDMMVQVGVTPSEVELEEAYLQTRALPYGLQLKGGQFLSDIGYINKQHIHDWDFVDQPWMREFLFGDEGLSDTGVQLSWVAPTAFYSRFGLEVLEGDNEGVANYVGEEEVSLSSVNQNPDGTPQPVEFEADNGLEDKSGPRLFTAFAKFAPDLGYDRALQLGVFGGHATLYQEQEFHSDGELETLEGDSWFAGVDAVYKYSGGGAMGQGDFTLQGEYTLRTKELKFTERSFINSEEFGPPEEEVDLRFKQDALYVQGLYGFAPRWNAGVRVDAAGLTNDSFEGSEPQDAGASFRYTGQVSFAPTEFSRIRAQLSYNDLDHGHEDDHGHEPGAWQFFLQYNLSLGQHGAHAF
ncbi:MAG: TonB-dependent receptor [Oleiphilaceae bacterium]|nr:TonB-dependent receptor [Oleiphilaceae bacterium]